MDARAPAGETHEVWLDGYAFGLIGSGEVDTRFYCESEAAGVGVHQTAATWALTVLSLGLYTPRVARITCARTPIGKQVR